MILMTKSDDLSKYSVDGLSIIKCNCLLITIGADNLWSQKSNFEE